MHRPTDINFLVTKVCHVVNFEGHIIRDGSKQLMICRQADTDNRLEMRPKMLYKLDARSCFLPKFKMAVDGCSDKKVVS